MIRAVMGKAMNNAKDCEIHLIELKREYEEKEILPSLVRVIDRLLAGSVEMAEPYKEITNSLERDECIRIIEIVLDTATFWNPELASLAREQRDKISDLNENIAEVAIKLSKMLDQRESLCNSSGFSTNYEYHVVKLLHASGSDNGLYKVYVEKNLEKLRVKYDLKYWPKVSDFIQAVGLDSENLEVYASDDLTDVSTKSRKRSIADYLRALYKAIDEDRTIKFGNIPEDFHLSDVSVASITNVALALDEGKMLDTSYVKRFRQRERNH